MTDLDRDTVTLTTQDIVYLDGLLAIDVMFEDDALDRPSFLARAARMRDEARSAAAGEVARIRQRAADTVARIRLENEQRISEARRTAQRSFQRAMMAAGSVAGLACLPLALLAVAPPLDDAMLNHAIEKVYQVEPSVPFMTAGAERERAEPEDEEVSSLPDVVSLGRPRAVILAPPRVIEEPPPAESACDGAHGFDPLNFCL